ncbi:variant erythrocyte surface antigen-1 alpha subunit [Babesia bovis T2Bo]|uniref:Variant erythrocyte surface antigen-1, alpha subunit n=1 Tax=Babesia bovis TaxID=5865 RepID=A7ALY9_BABBO|nr:variant erythrocyte surface antigen-1 alpha subunit [Babesia bovis T2Bo]EDO07573.1 variant erythrocyte surface antigen-1 alpha subunit [Babesia bovis T2Bo]|eukprot:XP_001611141.1 variant erythrocyte surface antigen-1, alpha subunit [Babesia bovis T2Bo]
MFRLAQVLSALVGWSKIEKCWGSGSSDKCKGTNGKGNQHGKNECEYLKDIEAKNKCDKCECMKWDVAKADDEKNGHHLGRGCKKCASDEEAKKACECGTGGCSAGEECKCAKEGKCCKCCCTSCDGCKENAKCSCIENGKNSLRIREHKDSYRSAYEVELVYEWNIGKEYLVWPKWSDRKTSKKRAVAARNLLGSVCLIWSGITYMYWTGKYHKSSPRWNNHILNGSGLDDGTLSQWLQALGFPKDMLNNHGPQNRLDKVIWDGIMDKLYLGFPDTGKWSAERVHGNDTDANTFRQPAGMNYAGYIHTVDRGAFCKDGTVFKNGSSSTSEENTNKCGALFKLYILSCAYFTGLQNKAPPKAENKTPKTIREILYWLSALPYSQAYKQILEHSKEVLKKVAPMVGEKKQLSFHQTGRSAPITVHEYNLFAHFQAVTQYCPLVLIGIQGGLHSATKGTKEPAIHSLYANTECRFTYPTVSIQAYNQVVHYIRALFYQLYFLRKQCAVKVALGGKWRECRYGSGVLGKDVVSWMCLGCNPMEHDRKSRVEGLKKGLETVLNGKLSELPKALKKVLQKIGDVVVQLGNAQEALEGKKKEAIGKVKVALEKAKQKLEEAKTGLDTVNGNGGLTGKLDEAKEKLGELTKSGSGLIDSVTGGEGLEKATSKGEYDPGKNKISEAINGVREALEALQKEIQALKKKEVEDDKFALDTVLDPYVSDIKLEDIIQQAISHEYTTLLNAIKKLISLCTSPKCTPCESHSTKCGQQPQSKICDKCHQQYMDGFPSPLQAFLEDRLPGFSCKEIPEDDKPEYPPAASHLGHCNGSGQCCPLPMGFRGQFHKGSTSDFTGARLYGILYFFSNENMMQSCVYTLVRVTAALSATTPQVLGDVFGFFRGGVGNNEEGMPQKGDVEKKCEHTGNPSETSEENKEKYFCGWCASGLRDVVKQIEWIRKKDDDEGQYRGTVGQALINIKGDKGTGSAVPYSSAGATTSNLSRLTKNCQYLSPLTGELYTAVSATFGGTYLSWVLYLSDALHSGLESLSEAFLQIECNACKGQCDPNRCKKGEHGQGSGQCGCQSVVSCTGVLPVLYRHGLSYCDVEALHYSKGEFY